MCAILSSETRTKGGETLEFDYSKLRGRIKELFGTQGDFAKAVGINKGLLSRTLNNSREFSQKEINKACEVLRLSPEQIPLYFFALKVQKHELGERTIRIDPIDLDEYIKSL